MNYLISAEAYHIIDDNVRKIVKKNNYITFNMKKSSIEDIIIEANYISLDNEDKIIVVSNADYFGSEKITDEEQQKLISYLEKPNEGTTIIFTTQNSIDSRKKIVKVIKENGKLININKFDKREINNYLTSYLREYNYDIDYQTINYIMDNSYNNLDIMINELDKIMLYYSFPCKIKYSDVTKIVGEELDSNNFHFISAVIDKDLKKALKILKDLKVYKVDATSLIILLAREYRLMYYVKNLYNQMNLKEMMEYLKLMDWQINKLYNNSLKYTNSECLQNIKNLGLIDTSIKKGIWDKDIALYGFLLDACS